MPAAIRLRLAGAQRIPTFHGHPVRAGQVGRSEDSIHFEQFVKPFSSAMEPQNSTSGAVNVGHSKHFPANIPVTHPVDEVMAPVQRLRSMRKRKTNLANSFVVHARKSKPGWREAIQFPVENLRFPDALRNFSKILDVVHCVIYSI